jgi:hypothetical protein
VTFSRHISKICVEHTRLIDTFHLLKWNVLPFQCNFVLTRSDVESFPAIVLDALKARNELVYLNDFKVRELQEHYLSTKGWRNDTESIRSKVLATEAEYERQNYVLARFGNVQK